MIEINKKILSVSVAPKIVEEQPQLKLEPVKRGKVLNSKVYRLKHGAEHALYVTIADISYNGKIYPYEIFFNTKDPVHGMWTSALTLLISSLFRQHLETGLNINPILENLYQVYDPLGGYWQNKGDKRTFMNSIVSEIADCIKEHINGGTKEEQQLREKCPKCGEPSIVKIEGCDTCLSCNYSKCG